MRKFLALSMLALAFGIQSTRAVEWSEDWVAAAQDARQNQKMILLNFSGSDWCGWCKRLDAEVFSQPAYEQFASSNLVSVLVDFPRSKKQSATLKEKNQRLAAHFQVQGFPTLLLFSPEGDLIGELGYAPGGPTPFIQSIQKAKARYEMRGDKKSSGPRLPL